MTKKKTAEDNRVSVDRDEYAALVEARNQYEVVVASNAKTVARNHDLTITCNAQSRRLVEVDQIIGHLERINGLQRMFIDMMRVDRPQVATMEELSDFWHRWVLAVEKQPQKRDEVAKLEPDLFRSWRLWVRDLAKQDHQLSIAGTRAEVQAQQMIPQATLQDHVIANLNEKTASLGARVRELEA